MRKLLAITLALGLLTFGQPTSAASDVNRRTPPRLSLRYKNDVVQRARPYTYCWSHSKGDGTATGICADGFPRYPRAAQVQAPARLVLRIRYPAKPQRWFLHAYRAIVRHEHYDETVGEAEKIPFKLRAHRAHGEVTAWDLVFRLEQPLRHYYLDTGGDLEQGDAFYALHVRTL